MKIIKAIFLFLFLFVFSFSSYSQTDSKESMYLNPMITVGYSIGSGLIYGFDLTYGFTQINKNQHPINIAISTKFYFINLNGYANRVISINLIAENEYIRLGGGFADITRKWGYKKRNVSKTYGPSTDFGIHFGDKFVPWFGVNSVFPIINNEWYERPNSIGIYTYFRQENILLFNPKN